MATLRLGDVEQKIRRHLEMDLSMSGVDSKDDEDHSEADEESQAQAALAKLSLSSDSSKSSSSNERAKQPGNQYLKELSYTHLRGTPPFCSNPTRPRLRQEPRPLRVMPKIIWLAIWLPPNVFTIWLFPSVRMLIFTSCNLLNT